MNQLVDFFRSIFQGIQPWIIIAPWEQALRVRGGKSARLLLGGIHFRIPWLDVFYVQQIRRRSTICGRQTVTSADGRLVTILASITYSIVDMELLYQTLHHAEDTVLNIIRAAIANTVASSNLTDLTPLKLQRYANEAVDLTQYGLGDIEINIIEYIVTARPIRLVGDSSSLYSTGDSLNTSNARTPSNGPATPGF